jgi:CheY-like chemotaxis protein
VDHWEEVRRKEREQKLKEDEETEQKRAAVHHAAPDLIKEGESVRPVLPLELPVPAPPAPPSIVQNYRNHFLIGLAIALMGALTAYTLFRHRREKEIRILTGKYLSDGTEAAWIQMPHLFAGAPASSPHGGLDLSEKIGEKEDAPADAPIPDSPLTKFFKEVPNDLAEIRKLLPELSKLTDEAERKKALFALYSLIDNLRTKAIGWDLRPVWQLSSALGLLVKRLAEKCKEATPTTIRTVATAIDLLSDLCVPGVRPDLIINPPIAVLAVDDDPLCLRAVMFALQKAEMTPDTAQTGEQAVLLATEKSYDVVFMDIKMPGIDGLRACEQIHELKKNENTPVVFVTSLSDFRTRAESTLAGGSDLLIKPFLMFEITVKVLIFTMRKRLGLAASLKREVASLTGASQLNGKAIAVLPAPHPAIPDELDEVEAPATREASVRPEIPGASQPNDNASTDLPARHPAIPDDLDQVEAPGANGSHHATVAAELSEPKKAYEGADLPALHMAPAARLERETRIVPETPAADKDERKTKKWLKRQKELASPGKFE